ncbi:MAG: hypothetical protein ABEJ65_07990, partial [bacterium]
GMIGSLVAMSFLVPEIRYDWRSYSGYNRYVHKVEDTVSGGIILTGWGSYTPLRYHQLENNSFKQTDFIVLGPTEDWVHLIHRAKQSNRAVFVTQRNFPGDEKLDDRPRKLIKGLYRIAP